MPEAQDTKRDRELIAEVREAARGLGLTGEIVFARPHGSGHINDTLLVEMSTNGAPVRYVLQRVNTRIFRDPERLMENMDRVIRHLAAKASARGDRNALELLRASDGAPFFRASNGNVWRGFNLLPGRSHDVVLSLDLAREAARAFGAFQCDLADFPPPRLHDTIPYFHDTPRRFEALEQAVAEDRVGRAKEVRHEIEFARARREMAGRLMALQLAGRLPERITHNDTKVNNVLIADETGRAVAVTDLDTVMPGLVHYDFGDLVRTSACAAPEDERDLSRVFLRFDYFEALLRGYLDAAGGFLTAEERRWLPFSGALITLEIGVRFLTDHLQGDVYFKIHRPNHNLDRARAQFRLVESIELQLSRMEDLLGQMQGTEK